MRWEWKGISKYELKEYVIAYLYVLPLILVLLTFIFVPVVGTFINSLYRDITSFPKRWVGLGNYIKLLGDKDFLSALRFTLVFTVVSVGLETILGLLFALLLNEELKFRGILRALILIPWAIPTIVSARIWESMYNYSYGLLNFIITSMGLSPERINWLGTPISAFFAIVIADVWKTTPFMTILLLAGLQAIPEDLYKQAKIDGANMFQRFRRITLPLLAPVLTVALIFRTIDAIRIFDLVFVLTRGGPGGATRTISFLGFIRFLDGDYGYGSAISIATFLLAFSISLLYLKLGKFTERFK